MSELEEAEVRFKRNETIKALRRVEAGLRAGDLVLEETDTSNLYGDRVTLRLTVRSKTKHEIEADRKRHCAIIDARLKLLESQGAQALLEVERNYNYPLGQPAEGVG